MSLKSESKEIFTRYGLNDQEITILLAYLGIPQATTSMISEYIKLDYEIVKSTTDKLVKGGFLKELPGEVNRYLPLEPYFSLFVKESEVFRNEIERIKDAVLQDQSKRFKDLEDIKSKATNEVDGAVKNQIDSFARVSDEHDADKKNVIDSARDRFTSTSKTLEKDIHAIIDGAYTEQDKDIKQMDADAAKVWNDHSAKFTKDNTDLNAKLDAISAAHTAQTSALEKNLHGLVDGLNAQLKTIANGFVSKYESGITSAKDTVNKIIADLLKDFTERCNNLETQMKKSLDDHVVKHKDNAQALKPTLEEILAKYMSRMHDVIEDLKRRITKLLYTHADSLKSTTDKMQAQLKDKVDKRQDELIGQVKSFEENTVVLIDNLADISAKLSDLSTVLAKRGSSFKALLLGKHKVWVALNNEVQERVTKLSGSMKADFTASTSDYIKNTGTTKDALKGEITSVLSAENDKLKKETDELDKTAQQKVNAELEGLAADLSTETDNTLKKNIEHCKDSTVKLKDSIQSSYGQHKGDYNTAINRHLKTSLDHYTDCDKDVKGKVDGWYSEMDKTHVKAKNDITSESTKQNADIKKHLIDTKDKNVEHAKVFETDKEATKKKQTEIYLNRLKKIRSDFDSTKAKTSEKINAEIEFVKKESKEKDDKLHAMLEDHKSKYKDNAKNLNQSLDKTIADNTQNTKDAIADFTLQFMNSIDEANDLAKTNETNLNDIFVASSSVVQQPVTNTWHVLGMSAIVEAIADALNRTKSSIIIVTHEVVPKVLEALSQSAYKKKAARFFYTTHWTPEYEPILAKMKALGNIQFRQLKARGDFIAMTRDAEEVLLSPVSTKDDEMIALLSTQEGYCSLYSQIIGPVFQANSRPV